MKTSLLHELLSQTHIFDYRGKLENEKDDNLSIWLKQSEEALEKNLNAEQLKLVEDLRYQLASREEYIDNQVEIKLLNLGIKIGMELQKAFDEEEENSRT